MADRIQGTFDIAANYEVKIVAPFDARMLVETFADLYSAQMQNSYPYAGMIASVRNDSTPANNGLYILSALPVNSGNWKKVGDNSTAYTGAEIVGDTLVFTKGDGSTDDVDISAMTDNFYVTGGTMNTTQLSLSLNNGNSVNISTTALSGKNVQSISLVGTTLNITLSDATVVSKDLNELYLTGTQFLTGISTHDFLSLTQIGFTTSNFISTFPGGSGHPVENIKVATYSFSNFVAKDTTIVVKIDTTDPNHHIIKLPGRPDAGFANHKGKRVRFFMKQNNLTTVAKNVMIATDWHSAGVTNKIISVNVTTKVNNLGYFFPLETLDVVDLFWDGEDWIALSTSKPNYSSMDANNFLTSNTTYITRG